MPEIVQKGQVADGYGNVLFATTIADPAAPTAAEINAAIPITYGLTTDGFDHQTSIATVTAGRYTLAQALEYEGVATDTLEVKWVYKRGATPNVTQATIGEKGTEGYIIHSLGYPNGHEFVTGDVINAILPIETGIPRDVPPTTQNQELQKVQKLYVTGAVEREVAVVAGA